MSFQFAHHRPLTPITPTHSPHPSAGSSIRMRTPGQLSLHEYRKMQVTPSPPAVPGQRTVKKRRGMSSLSQSESLPAKSPTQTFMPSLLSLSTPPMTPSVDATSEFTLTITPANATRVTNPNQATLASTYPELTHLINFDAWLSNSPPASPSSSQLLPLSASSHARSTSSLYQPPTPRYHDHRVSSFYPSSRLSSSNRARRSRKSLSQHQLEELDSVSIRSEDSVPFPARDIQRSRSSNGAQVAKPRSSIRRPSTADNSKPRRRLGSPISIAEPGTKSQRSSGSNSAQSAPHAAETKLEFRDVQSPGNSTNSRLTEQPRARYFNPIKHLPRPDSASKKRPIPLTLSSSSTDAFNPSESYIASTSTFSLSKFPFPKPPLHTTAPRSQLRISAPTASIEEKQSLLHSSILESPSVRFSGASFDLLNTRRSFNLSELGDISTAESDFSPTAHLLEDDNYTSGDDSDSSQDDSPIMSDEPPRNNLPRGVRYSNLHSAHQGVTGSPAPQSRPATAGTEHHTPANAHTAHNVLANDSTNTASANYNGHYATPPDSADRLPRNEVRQRHGDVINGVHPNGEVESRASSDYPEEIYNPYFQSATSNDSHESAYHALYDSQGHERPGTLNSHDWGFGQAYDSMMRGSVHGSIHAQSDHSYGQHPTTPTQLPHAQQNGALQGATLEYQPRRHGIHDLYDSQVHSPVRPEPNGLAPASTRVTHYPVNLEYRDPTGDSDHRVNGDRTALQQSGGSINLPLMLPTGSHGFTQSPRPNVSDGTPHHDQSQSSVIPAPLATSTRDVAASSVLPSTPATTTRPTVNGRNFDSLDLSDDDHRLSRGHPQGLLSYSDLGDEDTEQSEYRHDPTRASDPFEYDRFDRRTIRISGTLSQIIDQYGQAPEGVAASTGAQRRRIVAANEVQRRLAEGVLIRHVAVNEFQEVEDINRAFMDLATVPLERRQNEGWFMQRYMDLFTQSEFLRNRDFALEQEEQWEDRGMPMTFLIDEREAAESMPIFVLPQIGGPQPGDDVPRAAGTPGPAPTEPAPPVPSYQSFSAPRSAFDSSIQSHETTSRLLGAQPSRSIPQIWSDCRPPGGISLGGEAEAHPVGTTNNDVNKEDEISNDDHDWVTEPSRPTSLLPGFVPPAQLSSEPNEDIEQSSARFGPENSDIEMGAIAPVPTGTIGSVRGMSSLRPLITGPRRFLAMPRLTRHPDAGPTRRERRQMRHVILAVWIFAWIPFIPLLMGYGAMDEYLGWEVSRRDKFVAKIVGWSGFVVIVLVGWVVLGLHLAGTI